MSEPYYYVRFKWWSGVKLKEVSEELSKSFIVTLVTLPREGNDVSLNKDKRERLVVQADTLTAVLFAFTASLSQKKTSPLTSRDLKLRKKILELYPRGGPTPFPFSLSKEPKFEVSD